MLQTSGLIEQSIHVTGSRPARDDSAQNISTRVSCAYICPSLLAAS